MSHLEVLKVEGHRGQHHGVLRHADTSSARVLLQLTGESMLELGTRLPLQADLGACATRRAFRVFTFHLASQTQ